MGVTTSWAGMFYSVPVDLKGQGKVKFGVSAVSLDMKKESAIAWGEDHEIFNSYEYSDEIKADKSVIKPNEAFTIAYVDPRHEQVTGRFLMVLATLLLKQAMPLRLMYQVLLP